MRGLSIIIPTLNRPDILRESLDSLHKKAVNKNKEIILVPVYGDTTDHAIYKGMVEEGLIDKIIPQDRPSSLGDGAYSKGLEVANADYDYVTFTADDILYRTNWINVQLDMIESEWAQRHNVKIVSGFNHWVLPDDMHTMTRFVRELYESKDGLVKGYAWDWAGNWLLRKDFFHEVGGFENNLPNQSAGKYRGEDNYEIIMKRRGYLMNFRWATTYETYVQHMARRKSNFGFAVKDANGNLMNNERFKEGMAVGVLWKDI